LLAGISSFSSSPLQIPQGDQHNVESEEIFREK
jgi:hypothetical protein